MLLPAALSAADHVSVIKREVGKCAVAWQRNDYEKVLGYLPPRVIQQRGGRAATLREIKEQFAQARDLGAERLEALPGRIAPPKQVGSWLTSLIPLTAILHSAHLDLTQETHVLALSSDQGKKWFFVLLYEISQAELNAWFPEFKGKIVVPQDPLPKIELVY